MPLALTPPDPPLQDAGIRLRTWRMEDVEAIVAACEDPEIARFVPVPVPYTAADARSYVEGCAAAWRSGAAATFAIADAATDAPLGSVSVRGSEGNRWVVGYWVAPWARRRGAATMAVRLVSRWVIDDRGAQRLELFTDPENVPSQAVAERAGYRREGILRNYLTFGGRARDAVMFSLVPADLAAGAPPARADAPRPAAIPEGLLAAGSADAPWVDLITLEELFDSPLLRATRGDLDLLVALLPSGLVVTEDRCPHMAAPLSIGTLDGCVVDCPLHHGRFDLCSGETVRMPTTGGLDADGAYHAPWSPSGSASKPEPPSSKLEARRLTRVRRLRYYPVRIAGERVQARIPEA